MLFLLFIGMTLLGVWTYEVITYTGETTGVVIQKTRRLPGSRIRYELTISYRTDPRQEQPLTARVTTLSPLSPALWEEVSLLYQPSNPTRVDLKQDRILHLLTSLGATIIGGFFFFRHQNIKRPRH